MILVLHEHYKKRYGKENQGGHMCLSVCLLLNKMLFESIWSCFNLYLLNSLVISIIGS